jgi:carboxymethylenebutenolidase
MFGQVDGAKMREDLYQAARLAPHAALQQRQARRDRLLLRRWRREPARGPAWDTNLGAGVPFYGGQPSAADVAKIKGPHQRADRRKPIRRIIGRLGPLTPRRSTAAVACRTRTTSTRPLSTGFHHNDTTPRLRQGGRPTEAWKHTLDWFNKYLKA